MSCPFNQSDVGAHGETIFDSDQKANYSSILQLNKLLNAQKLHSETHDEHLFIVVHQVYELWFKQIIYELDSIREIFIRPIVDETNMLIVVSRLNRIVGILKILVDQITILETMTPLDFMEFRGYLSTSSGFQSYQFRLLENKLGLRKENRIKYAGKTYTSVFEDEQVKRQLYLSETEPSLFDLIERWLERTPGLDKNGFNFWGKFENSFSAWANAQNKEIEEYESGKEKDEAMQNLSILKDTFSKVLKEENYNLLRAKGERRFTWRALQGAMMISFYRDEVLFNGPFQILNLLMDIDSLLSKWRHNHVMLVQRQIGTKIGTGGSSGYTYLRSTVSDRYKAFLDLFNLSTYLIPKMYIPKLDNKIRKRFVEICSLGQTRDGKAHIDSPQELLETNGVNSIR